MRSPFRSIRRHSAASPDSASRSSSARASTRHTATRVSDWQSMLEALGIAYQVTGDAAYAIEGHRARRLHRLAWCRGHARSGGHRFRFSNAQRGLRPGDRLRLAPRPADRDRESRRRPGAQSVVRLVQARRLREQTARRTATTSAGTCWGSASPGFATEGDNPRGPRDRRPHSRSLSDARRAGIRDGRVRWRLSRRGLSVRQQSLPASALLHAGGRDGNRRQHRLEERLSTEDRAQSALQPEAEQLAGKRRSAVRRRLHRSPAAVAADRVVSRCSPAPTKASGCSISIRTWLPRRTAVRRPIAFVRFLFYDRARPAADYRLTQPTWFYSPGDHHFYRRSSWQPDAVWTSIAGGTTHWAGHQMRGAGHIAIQRGNDYLLVNSGQWKGPTGDFGTPQAFDLRSWRGNTLFVDDFGDYLFTDADYVGGQGYWGTSSVLAQDGGPEFGYMKTDLTTRVRHRRPQAVGRPLGALFLSQLPVDGERRGRGVRPHAVSQGELRQEALFPPQSRRVDRRRSRATPRRFGPGSSASVHSHAHACRAGSRSRRRSRQRGRQPSDHLPSRSLGFGREHDVRRAARAGRDTASSTTSMPATIRLQSTRRHDGWRHGRRTARSARRPVLRRWSAAGERRATPRTTRQAGRAFTSLADLLPNARYLIARNGTSIGAASASSQGVLAFRSSEGGLFTARAARERARRRCRGGSIVTGVTVARPQPCDSARSGARPGHCPTSVGSRADRPARHASARAIPGAGRVRRRSWRRRFAATTASTRDDLRRRHLSRGERPACRAPKRFTRAAGFSRPASRH